MSFRVEYEDYPFIHEVCVVGSEFTKYRDKIKGVREWFEDSEVDRSIGFDYIVKKEPEGFSFYLGYGVDNLREKYYWTVKYNQKDEERALQETVEILINGLDMMKDGYDWTKFPKNSMFYVFEYTGIESLNNFFDKFANAYEDNSEAGLVIKIESQDSIIEDKFIEYRGWIGDESDLDDCDGNNGYALAPGGFCLIYPSYEFESEKNNNMICAWIDTELIE